MELKGLKINFLGDSITEGVGTSAPDMIYHALLKKEAGLSEARNYGIGGSRFALKKNIAEGLPPTHFDYQSFSERFDKMDDDADAVVVFGGTNDYGHGDASLGSYFDRTPDTFYGACHYVLSGLMVKYLGKPIVVMTPLHRLKEEWMEDDGRLKRLKTFVDALKEVAEYYSIPVLDLFSTSMMQPNVDANREKFMPDGIHPNDAGHELIANKLKRFLEAL